MEEQSLQDKINSKVETMINCLLEKDNLEAIDLEYLSKLVDIQKDLREEIFFMNYRDYNDYNRRDYGRRGVRGTGRGRYRGEDMLNGMYNAYSDYMESADYGEYGTSESMQKIEIMTDSLIDFIHHIKREAKTPEEKRLIDEKLQEIGRL